MSEYHGPWIETTDTTVTLVDTIAEGELHRHELTVATHQRAVGQTEREAVIAALTAWHRDDTVPAQRWTRNPDEGTARGWWQVDTPGREWTPETVVAHIDMRRELGVKPERSRVTRDMLPEGLASRLRERSSRRDADVARQRHEDLRRRQVHTQGSPGRGL